MLSKYSKIPLVSYMNEKDSKKNLNNQKPNLDIHFNNFKNQNKLNYIENNNSFLNNNYSISPSLNNSINIENNYNIL